MQDLKLTTKERNELCARLIGWFQEDGQDETYFEYSLDENNKPFSKIVAYSLYRDNWKELPFHKDLNYTYKLLEKVNSFKRSVDEEKIKIGESLIDRFEIHTKSFFANIFIWTKNGWKDFSVYYVVGENCEDWKQGFYLFLSDILIKSLKHNNGKS